MHPTTMQAIAAERGADLCKDATAVRRARQARRSLSWQQAQPTQQARPLVPTAPMPGTRCDLKPAAR
jgi:hypothetical protein